MNAEAFFNLKRMAEFLTTPHGISSLLMTLVNWYFNTEIPTLYDFRCYLNAKHQPTKKEPL